MSNKNLHHEASSARSQTTAHDRPVSGERISIDYQIS